MRTGGPLRIAVDGLFLEHDHWGAHSKILFPRERILTISPWHDLIELMKIFLPRKQGTWEARTRRGHIFWSYLPSKRMAPIYFSRDQGQRRDGRSMLRSCLHGEPRFIWWRTCGDSPCRALKELSTERAPLGWVPDLYLRHLKRPIQRSDTWVSPLIQLQEAGRIYLGNETGLERRISLVSAGFCFQEPQES